MMKFAQLFIFLFFVSLTNASSAESANILDKGSKEIGLFQPLRWAYNDKIEVSLHPVLFFVIPNNSVKIWYDKYRLASKHEIFYPTPLLRLLQKDGMLGVVASYADVGEVPHVIAFNNELIKSYNIDEALVTIKGGFGFAIISDKLDERLSIDLPIVYPSMGSFFNGYKFNFGIDLRYGLNEKLDLLLDGDIQLIPNENLFWDSKLISEYKFNSSLKFLLGTKLTYGNYPYGEQYRLFPLIDIVYFWD